jgi:RNA polymerase-binding transcription factor
MKTSSARKTPLKTRGNGAHGDGEGEGNRTDGRGRGTSAVQPDLAQNEQLAAERREVVTELARLRAELQQAPERTGDEVDLSVYDREKTLALVANYERRLEEIDHARRAAQKGAYGICERCGKPIDPARLKIFPEATMCVQCKNEKEKNAKRGLL